MIQEIIDSFESIGYPSYLYGFSALDRYFGIHDMPVIFTATEASLIDLSREFDAVSFPGRDDTDAVLTEETSRCLIRTIESVRELPEHPLSVLNFLFDIPGNRYIDRFSVYRYLRIDTLSYLDMNRNTAFLYSPMHKDYWRYLGDVAVLISRYGYAPLLKRDLENLPARKGHLSLEQQRELLLMLLTSKSPHKGFSLLLKYGFIDVHWPELKTLDSVDHSKEYHPEGNAWEHTMETFRHRKTRDLRISLALLLHDIGKPMAEESEGRRFDRHAQLGGREAKRFLYRLGFPEHLVGDVGFLVQEHMLPAFIASLPTHITSHALSSPLFPLLLEVYRCDLSSTFRGPEGYYRACKAYRQYLKNVKNPFRDASGKKTLKTYVEG